MALPVQFYLFPYLKKKEKPAFSLDVRDSIKDKISSDIIPPQAGVIADIFLASHLSNRSHVYSTHYTDTGGDGSLSQAQEEMILSEVDYAIIDMLSVYYRGDVLEHIFALRSRSR